VKQQHYEPFVEATVETLEMMCGMSVTRAGDAYEAKNILPAYGIIAVMGFSGGLRGMVLLTMPMPVARAMVGAFVGDPNIADESDISDGMGEVLNILAGAATAKLPFPGMKISLPMVLMGKDQHLAGQHGIPWVVIPMRMQTGGEFDIRVSMAEA